MMAGKSNCPQRENRGQGKADTRTQHRSQAAPREDIMVP